MRLSSIGFVPQPPHDGEKRSLNSELWHACAGPLISLPAVGSRVVYFPQGHSEQVAASTNNEVVDARIPIYPSLSPQLICQLHNVTMHADVETDEVYAQMTLQPLNAHEETDVFLPAEFYVPGKQPANYFCKTLTASDTSTHGGFSVPRRSAEKVFPPLDFSLQPPAQELIARDLHDNEWKFRHIFRGQPKRHLLTTGWSVFVSAKKLVAGDSVLFIWNDKNQLLLGIRRVNRPQTVMPFSVLSSDSMHLGLLAAAAHAAATNSRFTVFFNPRASPSEFVVPLSKYFKSVYHARVSVGMRFRMLFENEDSSVRRHMGTITGIGDLDPMKWPNSHWRSVKVGWDESTTGERQPRISLWEIEPLTSFPLYPSPFPLRLKRPCNDHVGLSPPFMWMQHYQQPPPVPPWMHHYHQPPPSQSPQFDPSSVLALQADMYRTVAAVQQSQQMMQLQPPFLELPPPPSLQVLGPVFLPPLPGDDDFAVDGESSSDPQNRLLFGVNIDGLMPCDNDSSSSSSSIMNFMNSAMATTTATSSCVGESPAPGAFVKVYKTGSFGRSIEITKFSSYHELKTELCRMFGELEEALRCGWQLVFVDRENDVLLVGDDPWPEFVNSVHSIKILSPDELHQMRRRAPPSSIAADESAAILEDSTQTDSLFF